MSDLLISAYPWIKAFHIISVISWMAGLLYLPRLFVYHAEQIEKNAKEVAVFEVMEKKLFHFIMNKAMIASWVFGIILLLTPGIAGFGFSYWVYFKIICVLAMTIYHVWLGKRQNDFENGLNKLTSKTYRMLNEVPAVLMILIVILVIVKPF
jgi:putative membrane protein